jgi:hypothetical protein
LPASENNFKVKALYTAGPVFHAPGDLPILSVSGIGFD